MIRRRRQKKDELLSEKISNLLTVKPSADVEDDRVFGTKPKTVTRDDLASDDDIEEATLSSFRKRNVALLSELDSKYAGKVTSRKRPLEDSDGDNDDEEVSFSDNEENATKVDDSDLNQSDSEEEEDDVDEEEDEEGSIEDEGFDLSQMEVDGDGHFEHMKETDDADEVNKGTCVKNQMNMWENFLETRISLQKCLVTANKLPFSDTFKELKKNGGDAFATSVGKAKGSLTRLLSGLLELQATLLGQYSETKNLLKDKSLDKKGPKGSTNKDEDDDEEITSDSDGETKSKKPTSEYRPVIKKRKMNEFAADIAYRHAAYTKYRNGVIQKWHDKTKLNTVQRKNQPAAPSTMAQIEFLLGDKNKLIRRTQLKRSKYDIVGQKSNDDEKTDEENGESNEGKEERLIDKTYVENEEYCSEIFDDDDFYHQLLRELIEYKSADVSDPIQLSRQWIALQQLRSKMKRKIDTRATKGRRIRYTVHSKLVNFMAPQRTSEWTDDGKNELFASLFGKQYESVENGRSATNANSGSGLTIL